MVTAISVENDRRYKYYVKSCFVELNIIWNDVLKIKLEINQWDF